jgi:hypothetical protein
MKMHQVGVGSVRLRIRQACTVLMLVRMTRSGVVMGVELSLPESGEEQTQQ